MADLAPGEVIAILDSIQEGLEVVDMAGNIKYVNPAFHKITGIRPEARVGKNIYEVVPNGLLVQVLKTRRPLLGVRSKARGSDVEVVVDAHPLFKDGKMIGAALIFRDISDVLRLTQELNRSTAELHRRDAMLENLYDRLGNLTRARYTFADLVGSSRALREAVTVAKKAAESDSTILLTGESGTGKEIFAHAIHNASARREKPFIKVNCAAVPEHLLESEFFGYEKGAFTGAARRKIGMFELANEGTIFLDEIGDMSWPLQAKLLRFLQDQEFYRVGATEPTRTDVRVIAATNRELMDLIEKGRFREDLYYRLNVLRIHIAPLRERKEDIPELTALIIQKLNRKLGKGVERLSEEAMAMLEGYSWPGNVRELENLLERAMSLLVASDPVITGELLFSLQAFKPRAPLVSGVMPLDEAEKQLIIKALQVYGSSFEGKKKAAQALKISLATLYNKIKRYQLGGV